MGVVFLARQSDPERLVAIKLTTFQVIDHEVGLGAWQLGADWGEVSDARAEAIYYPYHNAIDQQIKRLASIGPPPAFISIHSFTPVLNGESRPWQVGILWDTDARLPDIFLEEFRAAGFVTGDNEPYSGKAPQDYTVDHHAEAIGLPHVGIEIRQDLISDMAGVERMAAVMHRIIDKIPERIGLNETRETA